jgi:outer membrane protein OmpA-like peptidoglycan-associated protein
MWLRNGLVVLSIFLAIGAKGQEPYAIKSIYFRGGNYFVDQAQSIELSEFIGEHMANGQYEITIHSHTDNIGGVEYNEWLSEMRSEKVIQKLTENLIDRESIKVKDFGQHNPVYENDTWEGRFKNRRVDVILWPVVF